MHCPKCHQPLKSTQVRETEVDTCPVCRGIWFDETELEKMMGLTPSELRPLRRGREDEEFDRVLGVCPRDGSTLSRVAAARHPDVVVDVCPTCRGIWLDAGEFNELLR